MEPEVTTNPPANVEVADIPLTLIRVPKVEDADVKRLPVMSTVWVGLVLPTPTREEM